MQGNLLSADSALIEEALQAAVVDTRNLARGIFPVHVDGHGLSAALADLALVTSKLTNARILFQEGASVDVLTPEASMHCYRIAQEAVSNSLRRGRASIISISLDRSQGKLTLRIEDNGCGFPPTKSGPELGMGLKTMQYRALAMKADLVIDSPPTGGTSVSCIIPISIAENPS